MCYPESGDLKPSFAGAGKYYGVIVDVCPLRHGWRKGVVEKANHSAAQRWWRTLPERCHPGACAGEAGCPAREARRWAPYLWDV